MTDDLIPASLVWFVDLMLGVLAGALAGAVMRGDALMAAVISPVAVVYVFVAIAVAGVYGADHPEQQP